MSFELFKKKSVEEEEEVILNQLMRGRNLMNVNIAMNYMMKRNTLKVILNKFMRGRNC